MPVVNTTNTFTNNEQITSTKLNDIMDNSSFVSGAVVTSGGLEITAGGQMQITSDGVTTARILDSNVTTAKIADGAVTPAKLSTAGPSWNSAGGTFTLSQRAIELGDGITSDAASYIDFHSSFPIIDNDARIIRESGANGTFTISNIGTGSINFSSAGGFQFASAPMPNPVGSAPIFGVRAWVNFEGRSTNGNCTIRSSGNVTSVARTAAGKYTVTFATAMPDVGYVVNANSGSSPGSPRFACADRSTATVSTVKIETDNISGNPTDFNENNVMVIR
jgi:hypothetical protein